MSFANLQIRTGFANYFQAFSATLLPIRTSIEQKSHHKFSGGYWILHTDYEILVSAKRLARDNVDLQLGNVEREVMRMCYLYKPDDIIGIDDLKYMGHERVYGFKDDYAKSNWETKIYISVMYKFINNDPM